MNFKYNTKQRNKTIQGLRSFKDTLPTKIKKIVVKKGGIYSKTLDNWRYIVGNDLFKICYPNSLKKSNKLKGSRLDIMVKRGHEIDLEYSRKKIIDKINFFFGYKVVEQIKILNFEEDDEVYKEKSENNVTKSKYNKKISEIKNNKIKESLKELVKLFKKK